MLILELTRSATNLEQPAVESDVFVVTDYLQAPKLKTELFTRCFM